MGQLPTFKKPSLIKVKKPFYLLLKLKLKDLYSVLYLSPALLMLVYLHFSK